jgi:hypothetical protein
VEEAGVAGNQEAQQQAYRALAKASNAAARSLALP